MAKDLYHLQLKRALEKDGWRITHDPFKMSVDEVDYEIDYGAEDLIGAEKGGKKIVVEGKGFTGRSKVNDFHRAVGQFNDYFVALEEFEPDRTL